MSHDPSFVVAPGNVFVRYSGEHAEAWAVLKDDQVDNVFVLGRVTPEGRPHLGEDGKPVTDRIGLSSFREECARGVWRRLVHFDRLKAEIAGAAQIRESEEEAAARAALEAEVPPASVDPAVFAR